jgi:hypothetical protein
MRKELQTGAGQPRHSRTEPRLSGANPVSIPVTSLLGMTEMLAALLGALVGGLLSAGVGAWQTSKVLKHETGMAAEERQATQHAAEARRQSVAADQLIAAVADYMTVDRDVRDRAAHFVRMMTTADVHRDRDHRAAKLLQAGASYAHALPEQVRERWDALAWMVRFNVKDQPDRTDENRRRDYSDLLNCIEYMRRSLVAVSKDHPMPPQYTAPDVRREARRVWGYQPEERDEPDLTDWQLTSRLVGEVKFTNGEVRWYGPNGLVEDLTFKTPDSD